MRKPGIPPARIPEITWHRPSRHNDSDGYKAGEGCLIEAKLWHVEEGHPWSDQLDRVFKQCKRATRGQGPGRKSKMDAEGKRKRTLQRVCTCNSECPYWISVNFFPSNAFMAFARSLHTFNCSKKMNCKLQCKAI